mgnify:CR=1 FL=1
MKRLTLLLTIILFINGQCFCQTDNYYYYKGNKVNIDINNEMFYITSSDSITFSNLNTNLDFQIMEEKGGVLFEKSKKYYWKIIQVKTKNTDQKHKIKTFLTEKLKIKSIEPVIGNEKPVAVSDLFYVYLKNANDYDQLIATANEMSCEIIGAVNYMPLWYILKAPASSNSLNMANYFYSTAKFKDVDPGFMFDFSNSCISDNQFNQQWALQNSLGYDINACEAWNITRGSSSVVVAVLDQGIDASHNEFSSNLLSLSYDTKNNSTPAQMYGTHGTHCAGIIGANQNGNQISGVAPLTSLMAISNPLTITNTISQELASGISWAWQNGADIISNSWGDQGGAFYNDLHSSLLESAIDNALTNGRNGRGCIIVFSAGNYAPVIDYPASYRLEILCIGSIALSGYRSAFSSYGTKLDVVAPGGNILSTLPNNQTGYMSGTSMAAPHVAGIAALVLSSNQRLNNYEVNNIIESTSQKIRDYNYETTIGRPNGTWNNEMGYGLVDAYAAVQAARAVCTRTLNNWQFTYPLIEYKECSVILNNISIMPGANIIFDVQEEMTINGDFNVYPGASFEIK